jgi:hypothetical protein
MTLLAIAEKKSSRENSYDSLKTATRNLETWLNECFKNQNR